jgi:hypothetical protein
MASFLSVHGYTPGPTQRPLLAGSISGVAATVPALPILYGFGSLRVESAILHMSLWGTLGAGWVVMAFAGAIYARLFGRAANNIHGGWVFGMGFGFVLWAAGADMILPLISGGQAPAGPAALGVALSMLVWGTALGVFIPFAQKPLHEKLQTASKSSSVGPNAAASQNHPNSGKRGA